MKTGKHIIVLAFSTIIGLITLNSCSDILEPKVYGDLAPGTFFTSASDMNRAVGALYSPFSTDWGFVDMGDNIWTATLYNADHKSYYGRSMVTTDELYTPYAPAFTDFTWGPASFVNENASTFLKIRFVARATDVIYQIETSEANVPESLRNIYIAEAKVLRAWLMYILYDFFGPLPVKLDPSTLHDSSIQPRPSAEEYVGYIISDLTEAIPLLPDRYNGDVVNWGRVSKGTARMVLLRTYMHEKRWVDAEAVARDILDMGYSLLPSYTNTFLQKANNEIIHAIPATDASPNWWIPEVLPSNFVSAPGYNVNIGPGWGVYNMPWAFFDTFEQNDVRRSAIISSYVNNRNITTTRSNMPGAIPLKYVNLPNTTPNQPLDQPIFRYAEVLLSIAEAINEQHGPVEAYNYVNQVRSRAGVSGFSGLSQGQLRDSLLAERGRELFVEGTRRMDLIRHGKFVENAIARGRVNAQPHHVLFPIPEFVIIQGDGVITQNPGY